MGGALGEGVAVVGGGVLVEPCEAQGGGAGGQCALAAGGAGGGVGAGKQGVDGVDEGGVAAVVLAEGVAVGGGDGVGGS